MAGQAMAKDAVAQALSVLTIGFGGTWARYRIAASIGDTAIFLRT